MLLLVALYLHSVYIVGLYLMLRVVGKKHGWGYVFGLVYAISLLAFALFYAVLSPDQPLVARIYLIALLFYAVVKNEVRDIYKDLKLSILSFQFYAYARGVGSKAISKWRFRSGRVAQGQQG